MTIRQRAFFRPSRGLWARVRRVGSLTDVEVEAMWVLFEKSYAGAERATFERDLEEKHHVILLKDAEGYVKGFSTLLKLEVPEKTASGLLEYAGTPGAVRLADDLADVPRRLLADPDVKFFLAKNPRWAEGNELCCLARADDAFVEKTTRIFL